jgi:hypothetical protein
LAVLQQPESRVRLPHQVEYVQREAVQRSCRGAVGQHAQHALLEPEWVSRDLGSHVKHVTLHPYHPRTLNAPYAALANLLKSATIAQHRRRKADIIERQAVENRVEAPPPVGPRSSKRARRRVARARRDAHAELPQRSVLVRLACRAVHGHA